LALRYTENQFDAEYIEVLREACFQYIQRQGDTTLKDIAMFVRSRGFSKVELREEDIHSIVNTLLYDGRVDQVRFSSGLFNCVIPTYFVKFSILMQSLLNRSQNIHTFFCFLGGWRGS
jgi:hypothetical protein